MVETRGCGAFNLHSMAPRRAFWGRPQSVSRPRGQLAVPGNSGQGRFESITFTVNLRRINAVSVESGTSWMAEEIGAVCYMIVVTAGTGADK